MAITGYFLSWNQGGESTTGWYTSLALAGSLCLAGSVIFIRFAKGRRIFEGNDGDND